MKSDTSGSYLEYKHLFTYLNAEHIKKILLLKHLTLYHSLSLFHSCTWEIILGSPTSTESRWNTV